MLSCLPSYGRDYKTAKEVREAWAQGKDFTIAINGHTQINREDAERGGETVHIHFHNKTKSVVIKPRTKAQVQADAVKHLEETEFKGESVVVNIPFRKPGESEEDFNRRMGQ